MMAEEAHLPSIDEFMQSACLVTGLSYFGDPDFQEPLRRFLDSCRNDAALNALGRKAVISVVIKALVNRLRFEDHLRKFPEILNIKIENPLIIVGLPRVGSTKLHRLLAANPNIQSFKFWQLLNPAPFPGSEDAAIDPRIAAAEQISAHLKETSPKFFAGYIPIAEDPEEDNWLFDLTFMQYSFILTAVAFGYFKWLLEQDMAAAFEYVKRLQQFMIWQNCTEGVPLVIKAPTHTLHLDILIKLFPDAKFVQAHRNPIESVASVMALLAAAVGPNSAIDHADQIHLIQGGLTIRMATRGLECREQIGEEKFLDVYYEEIRDNFIEVVRKVHRFWGVPLSVASEQAMIEWNDENYQHKFGKFEYSVADLKISPNEIIDRTRPYLKRFFPHLLR